MKEGLGSGAGSGAGSIALTNGSGSRRPKNIRIRRIWIRIRNTGFKNPENSVVLWCWTSLGSKVLKHISCLCTGTVTWQLPRSVDRSPSPQSRVNRFRRQPRGQEAQLRKYSQSRASKQRHQLSPSPVRRRSYPSPSPDRDVSPTYGLVDFLNKMVCGFRYCPLFRIRTVPVFVWYGSGSAEYRYRSGSGSNPDPGFWNEKKIEKNLQLKKKFVGSKTTINLSLGLQKGRSSYRISRQLSKQNIQHFKTLNFFIFSIFVGHSHFTLPDPDPLTWLESGSSPDSKHWYYRAYPKIYETAYVWYFICGVGGWSVEINIWIRTQKFVRLRYHREK